MMTIEEIRKNAPDGFATHYLVSGKFPRYYMNQHGFWAVYVRTRGWIHVDVLEFINNLKPL